MQLDDNHGHGRHFLSTPVKIVFVAFLLIAGFFLLTEHRAHLVLALPYLPWLLLAACPLLHLFMHHGHGGHEGHRQVISVPHTPPTDD